MGGLILLGCFDNALEVFRALGPSEGSRILAVLLQVSKQQILQVFLGTLHALRQRLPGENAEKAFDRVHPGGVRGSVVEMHPRMSQQSLFGRFVLVDVQVIQHNVKFA